ncbi:E3 ubiquitin-protein ligase rbbp6 [Orbilia brochopaga]|uniref:E3 ubiquitin-protein ligase rbbp6 n=1 Tax=Orbilia brochopaga TaxID=3140254 RepID=A0AAV9VCV8_9PEZI
MSSSIFFKFKSQKEPTRLPFDGTAISVFDAKRDIIAIHKLGDGTDFDLAIYNEENNEEYVDDTIMIPRGTAITARRLPPVKPGRGTAQRYVTGKMPAVGLSAGRIEKKAHPTHASTASKPAAPPAASGLATEGQTEEERIAAMFQASSEQWNQTQEQMANARPVFGQGGFKKKNAPAPNHPPPTGYVCYRCGEKGHWIQQCPTNADPNFDGRPRVKRTTGIPKSFLKTVDKPVITDDDDGKPVSVMVNAEGEYVVAEPDRASWELYQQKTKAAGLTGEAAAEAKLLEERGLVCPIDNKLFKDAVKTPCCKKTYCDDCIQNALVESDLVCPNCDTKEVLLDRLIPDAETREKVKEYLDSKKAAADEKDGGKNSKELSKSPAPAGASAGALSNAVVVKTEPGVKKESGTPKLEATKPVDGATTSSAKKRSAEDDGTSMKRIASDTSNDSGSKRLKSNPLSPAQQHLHTNTGNSPALQSIGLAVVGGSQNTPPNGMGYPQNGFMNGNGNMNMNGFDFNNMGGGGMSMGNNGGNMGFNGNNGGMSNMNAMNMNMANGGMGMGMGNMNAMNMNGGGGGGMMPNNMGYNNNNMNMNMNNMNNMNGMSMGMMNANGGGYNNTNGNMMPYGNMNGGGGGGGYNNMNNGMMNNNGYYNNGNNGYNSQPQQQFNNQNQGQWNMGQQRNMGMMNNGGGGGGQNMGMGMGMNGNMNMNMNNAGMNMNMGGGGGGGMMNQNHQGWNAGNNNGGGYQTRKIFSEPFPNDEDSPYMRKPVNPYRHMRPKRVRPSDYTAVGGGVTD